MEPHAQADKLPVAVAIAAPRPVDGAGSALRRAFPAPGALPEDMSNLLRKLDRSVSRSTAG